MATEPIADSVETGRYHSSNEKKHRTQNWLYRRHLAVFTDKLMEIIAETQPQSLLDAGCGEGFIMNEVARHLPEVKLTGMDTDEQAVAYAEQHFGEAGRFRAGSVYKLPFSDRSFDTVLCSEVLEHVDDPNRAVAELKRVARKFVVVTVPREPYFNWLNRLGQSLGLSPDPAHVNFWTKTTFQAFIRAHFAEPTFYWKQLYQFAVMPAGGKGE